MIIRKGHAIFVLLVALAVTVSAFGQGRRNQQQQQQQQQQQSQQQAGGVELVPEPPTVFAALLALSFLLVRLCPRGKEQAALEC